MSSSVQAMRRIAQSSLRTPATARPFSSAAVRLAEPDKKPSPKIHTSDNNTPEHDEKAKAHNEEMAARKEKSHSPESVDDEKERVPKNFWKGEGDQ